MANNFRQAFALPKGNSINWFPGHMGKGIRQMQQKLKMVDCVIEVHDARIPFSGRNTNFKHTITGARPHILVLNKMDLSDQETYKAVSAKIRRDEGIDHVMFTNCKDQTCLGVKSIVPTVKKLIANADRYNRSEEREFNLMIIGVPNVGKSSLTNVLRNRHLKAKSASAVGAIAGITRSVLTRIKISHQPLIFMYDTPGILTPNIEDVEQGMKLAMTSCMNDDLVGAITIADYILYWLNKHAHFKYVEHLELKEPNDNILQIVLEIAKKEEKQVKLRSPDGNMIIRPDIEHAARTFIKHYRCGDFGLFNLDKELLS